MVSAADEGDRRRGSLQHRPLSKTEPEELDDSIPPISAASAAGIFAEGSRFGTYVIGPCVGHGGMARIYRAEHEGLKRQVALKVLTDGVVHGTEGRARFLREARIAAAIKHPNVVNIYDIGVENRVPYLVMELLEGQDLEAVLHSHGALSESTIIDIIIPVVAGLVAVHDAGVVHRDLKPGNIFLSQGPNEEIEPKLLDFGISKAQGGEKLRLTSTRGLLMGTPLYMSPEALLGAEMTPLSDQYSLGVVMYECATGINPFVADNVAETARRVTTGDYPPLSEHAIRPSRRLSSIIERALSLDPKDRYPSMRALGQELLSLAGQRTRITWAFTFGEVAAAARPRALPAGEGSGTVAPKSAGGTSWTWQLAAALAVGLATVALLVTWSDREPRASRAVIPLNAAAAESSIRQLRPAPVRAADLTRAAATSPRSLSKTAAPEPATGAGDVAAENVARDVVDTDIARRDDSRDDTSQSDNSRSDGARPARSTPPRAARAVRRDPDSPEWLIERRERKRRLTGNALQVGTNRAPIFD
jgi:serine/threonine-protein kinase